MSETTMSFLDPLKWLCFADEWRTLNYKLHWATLLKTRRLLVRRLLWKTRRVRAISWFTWSAVSTALLWNSTLHNTTDRQTDRWTTGLCTVRTGCRNWNYCSRKVARSASICICKWRRKCRQFPPITQLLQRRGRAWLVSPSIGLHRNFTTYPLEYLFHNHSEKLIIARLLS